MVGRKHKLSRFAFTFIELIFAIVIIAISVISLPMMIQITARGVENNLVQEAIFAASAELMGVSAGYWDERSMDDEDSDMMSRVVDISGDCNATTRLRPGHILQPFHRRCLNASTTAGLDNNLSADIFSLDDFDDGGVSKEMFTNDTTDETGYKEVYSSVIDVNRTAGSNIKFIEISVTNSDGDLITTLKMQSANIGEVDYYKRRF